MKLLLSVLLLSISLYACNKSTYSGGDTVKGSGKVVSKEVTISEYTEIEANCSAQIIYEQDLYKEPYLKFEIDDNLLKYINIETDKNVLKITTPQAINTPTLKIYTNSKSLNRINLVGSSKIELRNNVTTSELCLELSVASTIIAKKRLVADSLHIKASGASTIKLYSIVVKKTSVAISGSTFLLLEGTSDNEYFSVTGASAIEALNLKAKSADIKSDAASFVRAFVSDSIQLEASGASNVIIQGNPELRNVSSTAASNVTF